MGCYWPFPSLCIVFVVSSRVQVATLTLITNNIGRCQKSLGACPAGGPHFQALQQWLSKGSSVFWATMPRHGGGTGGEVPVAAEPLSACVASYAIFHILGYVVTMHALWMCEHAARLSFIKRTEHITIKWRLEQLGSRGAPRLMRLLELAAVVLVATVTVHAALPFGMKLGGMSEAWSKVAAVGWQ